MSFRLKPDFEKTLERFEAFWDREIVDRPPVSISLRKETTIPLPTKSYANHQDRWLDVDFRCTQMAIELENREYLADGLPIAWPNLGPEIFSAWCGCGYEFGETTTWSIPCVHDWSRDSEASRLNVDHPLFKVMERFTDRLLELGQGNFIVGLTDFHPGGDHLAALRDPANLAMDMIEHKGEVKAKLVSSAKEYRWVYDHFYAKLTSCGMPCTTWTPAIHSGKFYLPSNDFSCMIGKEMFDEIFLPGIAEECRFLDRSLYHLDGPGALKHLDSLLDIPELSAVQWVPGVGREGFANWVHVYRKIQAAGKGIQLLIDLSELPLVFEALRPEGVWFASVSGIRDRETAEAAIARIARWR